MKAAIHGLGAGSGGSPTVAQLKQLMKQTDEICQERGQLENEFKNKTFDMCMKVSPTICYHLCWHLLNFSFSFLEST